MDQNLPKSGVAQYSVFIHVINEDLNNEDLQPKPKKTFAYE